MRRFLFAIASVGLLGAAPAWAQTESEEVVVTGERLREVVRGFVEELQPPALSEDQMARWNSRVCPLVAGIPARQAQYVVDRVAQRAYALDLRPGGPGCRANLLIFFTTNADLLAETLASDHALVAYYNNAEYGNSLGRDALDRFVRSDAPVRWWHVAQTVTHDGQIIDNDGDTVRTTITGRLQRSTRQDFNRAIIVVDAQQASGLPFEALSDYLAMVALAQLDASSDTSRIPSILNLFSERDAGETLTTRMTDWDIAYLEGLYAAPRLAPNTEAQQRAITRRMEEELQQGPAPQPQ